MKRSITSTSSATRGLLDEQEIAEIERAWPNGLTSRQIVDVFETRGIRFSEATLRKYLADHRDFFSNTQVRASHIMIRVEPNAGPAEKEKVKQKLLKVKKEVEDGTLTFAAAANKYSEDAANAGGAGGDERSGSPCSAVRRCPFQSRSGAVRPRSKL